MSFSSQQFYRLQFRLSLFLLALLILLTVPPGYIYVRLLSNDTPLSFAFLVRGYYVLACCAIFLLLVSCVSVAAGFVQARRSKDDSLFGLCRKILIITAINVLLALLILYTIAKTGG